tara:strand:+ start:235 stop:921 length:687 start_codon:yes stop_codon:yes gene_type:complete
MLALKQALSLTTIKNVGGWLPSDESSLVAWYKNQALITLNGSDVQSWEDSSANTYDMKQTTVGQQPAYSGGVVTFDSSADTNLELDGSQISLTGDFTLALRIQKTADNGTFLADNTSSNEFFKYSAQSDRISFKLGGAATTHNLDLDDGTTFGDDSIIITRDGSLVNLTVNGEVQTVAPSASGTALIDNIGLRKTDINGFDGTIKEIQIYSSTSAALTANANARLIAL